MSGFEKKELTDEERLKKELEIQKANLFGVYNHCRAVAVRKDYAEVALDIVPDSLNFQGTVHGAAYYTMADICSGMVCRTDGRRYVTQQANVQYLRAAQGGTLTARGTTIHRGRTSCLVEIRITGRTSCLVEIRITDQEENLLFTGTFLFHCIS